MPSESAAATDSAERARLLYEQGKISYAIGDYPSAIALFEQSYALSRAPALLFNLAQAHRLAGFGHCRRAHWLYGRYLDAVPHAENASEVEERIRELEECRRREEQQMSAPIPQPTSQRIATAPLLVPVPVRGSSAASSTAPVLTTGVGVALLVAGGVLYARGRARYAEAEGECPCYPGTLDGWETATQVSYALMALGAVTTAGGAAWWVSISSAAPAKHADVAWLTVNGHF
jgi:tetratricopeptide (TPR) repeat protein